MSAKVPSKAVDDEDPADSPMTRRGEDGRAHRTEDLRPLKKLPRRQDQPAGVLLAPRVPSNPD